MTRQKTGSERGTDPWPDDVGAARPVGRTRSISVISAAAIAIGLVMAVGGLILAEPAVFGAGTLLAFQGMLLFVAIRFLAIAANRQIQALHEMTATVLDMQATSPHITSIPQAPTPRRAATATEPTTPAVSPWAEEELFAGQHPPAMSPGAVTAATAAREPESELQAEATPVTPPQTAQARETFTAKPSPKMARPARPIQSARLGPLVRCPRCRHQQHSAGAQLVCESCGYKEVTLSH